MTHSTAPAHPKKAAYTRAALCLLLSVLTFCYAGPLHQDATTVLAAKRILPVYSVERDDRVISISFDASWGGDQTMRILDLLDEYNAKATFFLVGIWVDKYPELVKEKTDEDGAYQLNLKDLAELSRIEDVETRNRILKDAADSRQIKWKVEAEIKNKEREKNKKIIVELLEEAGIKKATKEIEKKKYTAELKDVKTFSLDKEPPKKINIRGKELYYLDGWNGIDVVKKLPKSEKVETEWDRQRKKIKQLKTF